MNLSGKASLNPNAADFVPFALRSPSATVSDKSSIFGTSAAAAPGKAILDHSESSISNNSDDEVHQYWRHQLPDDIIPDFKVEDTQEINGLSSFSTLSLNDTSEGSRFTSMLKEQGFSPHSVNVNSCSEKLRYPVISYGEYPSPKNFQTSWEKGMARNDQILDGELGYTCNGNLRTGLLSDLSDEQLVVDNGDASPLEFLASQFPSFAAESLAEVYFANAGDLNLTIEMLTQLEVDGGLNHTLNQKASSTPNLNALDFPSLSVNDGHNGISPKFSADDHHNVTSYRSPIKDGPILFRSKSSIPSRGASDFTSAVRKIASQDSSIRKYERNGSSETSIGSSRSSHVLASSYNSSPGRGIFGNRVQNRGSAHASLPWLETGEAVANIYSETREEARDHARSRNVYFEQARQAYIIGNKALAKELSAKGHLHNMYMKVAHGKAQESIFRQRNPGMQGNGRERMIDLHGLHVNEAIHVLKHELAALRNAARSADQRLLAFICVGTGHHTRGSRSPICLPIAVQRYLLEEEGLDYTEPQPGLLRVVIF